jgi:hypothetical protein
MSLVLASVEVFTKSKLKINSVQSTNFHVTRISLCGGIY